MTDIESAETAWKELLEYGRQPGTIIETARESSVNEIGTDSPDEIFFRKNDGRKRKVPQHEFIEIWEIFQADGQITRKQVGDLTADGAGAALFGAMNDIFHADLDTSGSSMRLYVAQE